MLQVAQNVSELIGNTPILKIPSLSKISQCDILVKCEQFNPGGSIKDRAALQMIQDAIEEGSLKPGMTIVEGTAGNTGIGLTLVARSLGFNMLVVMPKGQSEEKERMIKLLGGKVQLMDAVPFSNENHFYHTARKIAESNPGQYWWANQFENLSNFKAHYENTGPEILQQTQGNLDFFIASAGTGGTIGGNSAYLKKYIPHIKCYLVDPQGSGLKSYLDHGVFKSEGSSFTEGIGIMRLVANFKEAKLDGAITISDQDLVTVANFVKEQDGILLGSSSALNVAGALWLAVNFGPGKRVLTFSCDLAERSHAKLYNSVFLTDKGIQVNSDIHSLIAKYQSK
jgi:cysteine synthase